jgi:hypothetical protein
VIGIRTEHRRFALWAAAVLVIVLPVWWLIGADLVLALLRPAAALLFRISGLEGGIDSSAQGWSVSTGLPLADGRGDLIYPVSRNNLRRLLLGFPLLLAFLCAPPRTPRLLRAILIGSIALSVVFLLSLTAYVWGELAPMLNPALAPAGAPPTALLAAPPLHPAWAQTVLLGRYAGMSVLPLLTALLVWAAVNPTGLSALWSLKSAAAKPTADHD